MKQGFMVYELRDLGQSLSFIMTVKHLVIIISYF